MALMRCDFFSETLGLSTSMTVILPQQTSGQIGMTGTTTTEVPVLYLLHGLSDDDTIWSRRTSIERYVAPLGLAVVMPQVHQSFYSDEVHGLRFWTFLTEELPALVNGFFTVSNRREDTFVAGLSMGGYGALKWALRQPERFAAAASLSGAVALSHPSEQAERNDPAFAALMRRVFGDTPTDGTNDDVLHLMRTADPTVLPSLYVACGTDDFLYRSNLALIDEAERRGVPLTVDLGPGDHEWDYWDAQIQRVLSWLPLRTQ
jgi:S-formylglutathione hydrolase FrmB